MCFYGIIKQKLSCTLKIFISIWAFVRHGLLPLRKIKLGMLFKGKNYEGGGGVREGERGNESKKWA